MDFLPTAIMIGVMSHILNCEDATTSAVGNVISLAGDMVFFTQNVSSTLEMRLQNFGYVPLLLYDFSF